MKKAVHQQYHHQHKQQQQHHQQSMGLERPLDKCFFGISLAAKDLGNYAKRMHGKVQHKIRQHNRAQQEIQFASEQASLYKHFVMIEHILTVKDQEKKMMQEMEDLRHLGQTDVQKEQKEQQRVIEEQKTNHTENLVMIKKHQYKKEDAVRAQLHEIQSRLCLNKGNVSGIANLRAAIAA